MVDWTIDKADPARLEIVERAKTLGITGTPDKAAHGLGSTTLADGKVVQAHVVHAVDPIITDGHEVVLINRKNAPGKGKPALPGGFLDPTKGGGVELAVQAGFQPSVLTRRPDPDYNLRHLRYERRVFTCPACGQQTERIVEVAA